MKKVLLSIAVLALASGFAWAQTLSFEELDTDQDGMISLEEGEAAGMDVTTADTDGDGALSMEEYQAVTGE